MAQLGFDEIVTEVQTLTGRGDGDSVLVTSTRILRWANEAQREIAEKCPGLLALDYTVDGTKAVTCQTSTISYDLADWSSPWGTSDVDATTANRICHIYGLYFQDGEDSYRIDFMPVDRFDAHVIDPSHTDYASDKPQFWTRLHNTVLIYPICDSTYTDKPLKLRGSLYPRDFSASGSSCESVLEWADEGIIDWCVMRAYEAIGGEQGRASKLEWRANFEEWLAKYRSRNDLMHEWAATLYETDTYST